MSTSQTSRDAINSIREDGTTATQRSKIFSCLANLRQGSAVTRRQIAAMTGLELGAVAGRVNGLIKDEVVVEVGTVKCDTTNKTVKTLQLAELL